MKNLKLKFVIPFLSIATVATFAAVASNNIIDFKKATPEETSYFLKLNSEKNAYSEDDLIEYSQGVYVLPAMNESGYEIPMFCSGLVESNEAFGAIDNGFSVINSEPINGIKNITINFSNHQHYRPAPEPNPLVEDDFPGFPAGATDEERKAIFIAYIVNKHGDVFNEDFTEDMLWEMFLELEAENAPQDESFYYGYECPKVEIHWGWTLEDLMATDADEMLPYYVDTNFDNSITFDFFDTAPNYFIVKCNHIYPDDFSDSALLDSIIVEYTCNPSTKPVDFDNYPFTYIYHNDFEHFADKTDYCEGKYIEITAPKDPNITSVTFPESIDGYGVQHIGNRSFYYCENLSSVTLPSTLKDIDCCAFQGCENITSIDLPEGLLRLSIDCLRETNISTITIPESVIEIGTEAFMNTNITSLYIPKNVSVLSAGFAACTNLETIEVDDENPYFFDFESNTVFEKKVDEDDDSKIVYRVVQASSNTVFPTGYEYLIDEPWAFIELDYEEYKVFDLYNITATISFASLNSMYAETVIFGPNVSLKADSLNYSSAGNNYIYLDVNTTLLDGVDEGTYYFNFTSKKTIFINVDEGDLDENKYKAITSYYYAANDMRTHKIVYLGKSATGLPSNYKELAAA